MSERIICWFSCGAASAVAVKMAISVYGDRVVPVYCNTLSSEQLRKREDEFYIFMRENRISYYGAAAAQLILRETALLHAQIKALGGEMRSLKLKIRN